MAKVAGTAEMTRVDEQQKRAVVASDTPGRLRVRVHRSARNPELMRSLHAHLRGRAGVAKVETNAATGSVMVQYDVDTHSRDDLLAMFRDIGVIVHDLAAGAEAELPEVGQSTTASGIVDAFDDLDRRISRFTGGSVDLRLLLPLAMGAIGLVKVMRDGLQLTKVPGYVLLWYAFDAFYKLHVGVPKPAAASNGATAAPESRAARRRGRAAAAGAG